MADYDFLNLSPHEFENLSRDLLQKKLEIFIESFTIGRDGGVDFRYSKDDSGVVIIQAKRFKDYNSLYNHLKKEVDKVKKMTPQKYILITSAGLTPSNKDTIKHLFEPYIKHTLDIYGKDDLNNLLSIHKDIELKYFKLWLTSTNILERILHSRIYNQSAFELEEIREQVKLYVQNDSFYKALGIIKKNKYIIISGIPGIGKTTLSRVLTLYLLSNGFEEFVYLGESIDDGYEYFTEGKRQVFFFDDFLGRNFFEKKLAGNSDNKIVKFINKIQTTPDKILILATREYILNQAINVYEAFKVNNIEIAKCVLDLTFYTKLIQAQIIYNHLYFSDVPLEHLKDLISEIEDDWLGRKKYSELVGHPNYNPRIIETIVKRRIWENCKPWEFAQVFKSFLDNPESVWLFAFENSLDEFSRYALIVLLSMGTPVKIEDWERSIKEYLIVNYHKYKISFDPVRFGRTLRELENTFIKTQKDSYSTIAVEYQNPSIQDFLVNYLRNKNDLVESVITSSIFTNQFFTIFTTIETEDTKHKRKIKLNEELTKTMVKRIEINYELFKSCKILKYSYEKRDVKFIWGNNTNYKYKFLNTVYDELGQSNITISALVYYQFQKNIYIDDLSYSEQKSYFELLVKLDKSKLSFDEEKLLFKHLEEIVWLESFELFFEFQFIFPETYSKLIASTTFKEILSRIIRSEMSVLEYSDISSFVSQIELIEEKYNVNFQKEKQELEEREKEYESSVEEIKENIFESNIIKTNDITEKNESKVIDELFISLVDKDSHV